MLNANDYRFTIPVLYSNPNCPGHTNPGARQGHYIRACTLAQAWSKVHRAFGNEYDYELDTREGWGWSTGSGDDKPFIVIHIGQHAGAFKTSNEAWAQMNERKKVYGDQAAGTLHRLVFTGDGYEYRQVEDDA
jgi:hypothetical protein